MASLNSYSSVLEVIFAVNISSHLAPHLWNHFDVKKQKILEKCKTRVERINQIHTSLWDYMDEPNPSEEKKSLAKDVGELRGRMLQVVDGGSGKRAVFVLRAWNLFEQWKDRLCFLLL